MAGKHRKNDKISVGFATGLLMPFFVFLLVYVVRYPDMPLFQYLAGLWQFDAMLKVVTLCVFPNLFLFLLYIRRKMDYAARGVLAATFIYAVLVFASKII